MAAMPQAVTIQSHVVYNDGSNTFQSLGFVFLAFLSFFFVFVISGMTLVRERTGGTLERLLMTPIKRWQVMTGYTVGYGVFAMIQSVLIVVFVMYVLKMPSAGSIGLIFLVMLINAVVAVLFGAMASIVASSEMQVAQMIPVLVVPQVFFCGLIPQGHHPLRAGEPQLYHAGILLLRGHPPRVDRGRDTVWNLGAYAGSGGVRAAVFGRQYPGA